MTEYGYRRMTLQVGVPQELGDTSGELYLAEAAIDQVEISIGDRQSWQPLLLRTGLRGSALENGARVYVRTLAGPNAVAFKVGRLVLADGRLDLATTTTAIGADLRVGGAPAAPGNPVPVSDAGGSLTVDVPGTVTTRRVGTDQRAVIGVAAGASGTLFAAAGAGVRNRIRSLILRETAGVACTVTVRDGAIDVHFELDLAAGQCLAVPIGEGGWIGAANTAMNVAVASAGAAAVSVYASGVTE